MAGTADQSAYISGLGTPIQHAAAVVPSDTVDLMHATRGLYIGVTGDVRVITIGGETVTFTAVPAGLLPVMVTRVFSTGTTAMNLLAVW